MSDSQDIPPPNAMLGPRFVLPPWRVSFYGSIPALAFAFLYGVFSVFETIRLPLFPGFSAAYLLGTFSTVTAAWGVAALARRKRDGHTMESGLGLGLSLVALGLTVVAAIGYAND